MIRTNGLGLVRSAEARRGAARPNVDTPRPRTGLSQSGSPEIRAYADARTCSNAAGSSSKRSSETHPTGRSSASAHSARKVDLP